MYAFDEMIDMGLPKGGAWKSDAHRSVAISLAICNPNIRRRDDLIDIVQKVNAIPDEKIKLVTLTDLPGYGIQLSVVA